MKSGTTESAAKGKWAHLILNSASRCSRKQLAGETADRECREPLKRAGHDECGRGVRTPDDGHSDQSPAADLAKQIGLRAADWQQNKCALRQSSENRRYTATVLSLSNKDSLAFLTRILGSHPRLVSH